MNHYQYRPFNVLCHIPFHGQDSPLRIFAMFEPRLFDSGESLQLLCPQGHLIQKKNLGNFLVSEV